LKYSHNLELAHLFLAPKSHVTWCHVSAILLQLCCLFWCSWYFDDV